MTQLEKQKELELYKREMADKSLEEILENSK